MRPEKKWQKLLAHLLKRFAHGWPWGGSWKSWEQTESSNVSLSHRCFFSCSPEKSFQKVSQIQNAPLFDRHLFWGAGLSHFVSILPPWQLFSTRAISGHISKVSVIGAVGDSHPYHCWSWRRRKREGASQAKLEWSVGGSGKGEVKEMNTVCGEVCHVTTR